MVLRSGAGAPTCVSPREGWKTQRLTRPAPVSRMRDLSRSLGLGPGAQLHCRNSTCTRLSPQAASSIGSPRTRS